MLEEKEPHKIRWYGHIYKKILRQYCERLQVGTRGRPIIRLKVQITLDITKLKMENSKNKYTNMEKNSRPAEDTQRVEEKRRKDIE